MRSLLAPWRRRHVQPQVFLESIELSSGCGRLADAVMAEGHLALAWDLLDGPQWDLTSRANPRSVR
eukprot:1090291-Pyramimonas_sp.AAC.1